MSWAVGITETKGSPLIFNALRFRSKKDAERYSQLLRASWWAPHSIVVVEKPDEPARHYMDHCDVVADLEGVEA